MTVRILNGDCRAVMATLDADSVHTCVTSPPYYGLRDYGIPPSIWGGNPICDHDFEMETRTGELRTGLGMAALGEQYRGGGKKAGEVPNISVEVGFCRHCGAWRGVHGLEPTIALYVANAVEVFRAVHRVLRPDGTLWLNLGMSYASGDMRPSQSRLLQRVPACDSDDKAPPDLKGSDFSCPDLGDEYQDDYPNRRGRKLRNVQSRRESSSLPLPKGRYNARKDSSGASPYAFPVGVPVSKTRASFRRDRASCAPLNAASESQTSRVTCDSDAGPSAHNSACTSDIAAMPPPFVQRRSGKESFFSACSRPDCLGVGRCGLCWCELAIASLKFKPKDELNAPHLVAMALQADGWFLRQTIVYSKPNPMPESVTDRCTKAHEYIFLLTKSERYFYDAEAIKEPQSEGTHARFGKDPRPSAKRKLAETGSGTKNNGSFDAAMATMIMPDGKRNKRSVWTVASEPSSEAHFAMFPTALIEPCILAGSPPGGVVLDPFGGAGTTGLVADRLQRDAILIELSPNNCAISERRIHSESPLFADVQKSHVEGNEK